LRESEQNYRMLFESIDEGFCIVEVLFDQNEKPVDYRFLQISPSFERQTGIKNAAGRRMREIAPQHEEHWFEIYSVEWVIDDGNRASEVIRRVRALTNKSDIEMVPLDVNDVVRETIRLVQRELNSQQVSLRSELASPLPMVLGDRVQLQQVIINLVMKGTQAMQSVTDRSRELVIRSGHETGQVVVSVTDCGAGISAENAGRLFNPFFTTKSSGMGMGLSISRSIIDGHGGRLWATANVPHGATFQFMLPVNGDTAK
jgi:signal transduction histidine kinase